MKIVDMLKADQLGFIKISFLDRWLYYDNGFWFVCEKKYRSHDIKVLVQTENEETAVQVLIGE
jgi:hypothetical protein